MTSGGAPSRVGARVAGVDVDGVAAAVLSCLTVDSLSGGIMGEVATYLPGRRVRGVVVRESRGNPAVEVHVVGRFGPTMAEISAEVRAAVLPFVPGADLTISIDDLAAEPLLPDPS